MFKCRHKEPGETVSPVVLLALTLNLLSYFIVAVYIFQEFCVNLFYLLFLISTAGFCTGSKAFM